MVLAVVTIAAYWPVLSADFINFDDPRYVTENRHVLGGLSFDSLKWAFSMEGYAANWHPLTWLSHMLDCELFDQNAGLHHLTNLIIHTTSAVLLLFVLVSMTGEIWPSVFVAGVFALHPLHVESVAWIAERKDVLSGLFWMLTMVCYLRYTRTGRRSNYILALVVFGLGLMSKPMLVTLPFVLLLLDYWPLKRFESYPAGNRFRMIRSFVVEKIPFFALSGASCVVTYIASKTGGAVQTIESVSFSARLSNAIVSYVAYIAKMIWPVGLAVLYPFKQIQLWQASSALLLLVIITVAAVFWRRRCGYFTVGWLWYVGTLVPVIGLVQVGVQSLADRYTYIPLIGLFIIIAWGTVDLCSGRKTLRIVTDAAVVLLLAGMFAGTRNQLVYWKDSIALCRRAIEVTENNYTMHNNLGNALKETGRMDEAISQYSLALQINPDYAHAHNNLGAALAMRNSLDEAINHYLRALEINPNNAEVHNGLGAALAKKGQLNEAISYYHHALKIDPDHAKTHNNLAAALAESGQLDEAVIHFRRSVELDPEDVGAVNNLGIITARIGQLDEALIYYHQALKLQPEYLPAINDLAWILATAADPVLRDPTEAVLLAEKGCDLTNHNNPLLLNTLAVAYASADRFDDAVSTAKKALELAETAGNKNLAKKIRGLLKLFKEDQSYIQKPTNQG